MGIIKPAMQVHLDFHTSPDIEGIGSRFTKENFQAALKTGNLNSITVFAKCHHGMCYYPTKVGTMHPKLDFDLTGAMIDAAHEVGVRAPVYITAGWSHIDAVQHPEWIAVMRKEDIGKEKTPFVASDVRKPYGEWNCLCLNDSNGYTRHIYELTEEICLRYKNLDGLFYDICSMGTECYCDACLEGMKKEGLNPDKDGDARKYFVMKRRAFFGKCRDILKKYHPGATIFFNGCANKYKPQYHEFQSHFEMEDLPTVWGGYDKLPMNARYFGAKTDELVAMTGKFHLSWGEFGGFKFREALKFEVATMALYGSGGSIGDHVHPDCEMDMQTYENIGYAYRYLEKIAPFCYGGESVANLGVYLSEDADANDGVSKILLENSLDFGLVSDNDFSKYDTVIIPGRVALNSDDVKHLEQYVKNGGKLVLVGDALVKDGRFLLDFGVDYESKSEYDCDYIIPLKNDGELPSSPMLCYFSGHNVKVRDAEVYAETLNPYFNRTRAHFCGHRNTPYDKDGKRFAAIVKNGNVVYISHHLANEYLKYGSLYHKRYFMMALGLVYNGGMLRVEGLGAQGRCTMIHQPDKHRYCINMVYASPVKRGEAEVIEDIIPLYDLKVSVATDKAVKKVYIGLTDEQLEFGCENGMIRFTVPKLECHTSVVVEY